MENLISELRQPSTNSNGEIIAPSLVKRRAADAIAQLMQLYQQDAAGRLKAEQECDRLLFLLQPPDISAYQAAMNADRD